MSDNPKDLQWSLKPISFEKIEEQAWDRYLRDISKHTGVPHTRKRLIIAGDSDREIRLPRRVTVGLASGLLSSVGSFAVLHFSQDDIIRLMDSALKLISALKEACGR